MTYEEQVIKSAKENHIWLNAFACINPSDSFCRDIGKQILEMLDDKRNLIYDYQDAEDENLRKLGKLTPEMIVRFNKS